MKFNTKVGIVSYGAYIPLRRIKAADIAAQWGKDEQSIIRGLGIKEKSVPGADEDTITMAVSAAQSALDKKELTGIGAIYTGSESHPYAVKSSSAIIGEALGIDHNYTAADLEFACKAGSAAIQMAAGLVSSGAMPLALAIGSDTAQSRPNDALEFSAAASAAAFVIGSDPKEIIAELLFTSSFTSDTPDFWRREGQEFPKHGARFTGEPAYFKHVLGATKGLLEKTGHKATDFDYVVFHQPNPKFPIEAAKILGIDPAKLKQGLLTPFIGNTYSGATPLGLASILDVAKPGQMILATSFGSGAGSDSFAIKVTDVIIEKQNLAKKTSDFINGEKVYLTYGEYVKHRRKLKSI